MSIIKVNTRGGGGGKALTQQRFTSPGTSTWTRPAGCTKIKVTVVGGGGGSGGSKCVSTGSDRYQSSGAGGGGGTSIKLLDVTSIASVSVTVGAGGALGTASNSGGANQGSTGGTSSFGSYATAVGGGGGWGAGKTGNQASSYDYSGHSGYGGTAADGDINLKGQDGEMVPVTLAAGGLFKPNDQFHTGAAGGRAAGIMGGNTRNTAASGPTTSATGSHGDANTGNGAQGSVIRHTIASINGANGGTGIVIVDEFYG